ncbi:hypothetical protein FB561_1812 [Kribbella amoyensis]|uniref:DUF8175 domain-containing protein n=1 Tax=Kribbella amoyensis TaxID=996641 RepID=A0A561BPC7_9ACTN|nr:hypothetical protein [Kribbella amoyensis]TWD80724.1 hypothetical protein FB561_1812 [Kribbella amoyensis]
MTEKKEENAAFGRGFVAAAIVVGAVLLCGVLLLITGLTSSGTADAAGTASSAGRGPGSGSGEAGSGDADPGDTDSPGDPGGPATPDGDAGDGGDGAARVSTSGCGLADGDQRVPTEAPAVETWEVSRRVVVPRSRVAGPVKVDADGFRRCFAHSPTGALYAAYNAIAAMGDQRKTVATAGKLMLPGPNTDALLTELRGETPSEYSAPTQIAAYRVVDASRDRFTVTLALPVQSEFVSATLTLVWHAGDWRLVPPVPGEPVGAPFAQHRDLDGFVAWSGV